MNNVRPKFPFSIPNNLKILLESCWHQDSLTRCDFQQIVSTLTKVSIECAIDDLQGQLFWNKCFNDNGKVMFNVFAKQFFEQYPLLRDYELPLQTNNIFDLSGYVGESGQFSNEQNETLYFDDAQLYKKKLGDHLLKIMRLLFISSTTEESVDVERFGKVMKWVGPFENDPFLLFHRLYSLYKQKWFFGTISTEHTTDLLMNQKLGTFLVRFCNSADLPGYYVLSFVTVNKSNQRVVANIRIEHSPGGKFQLQKIKSPPYDTLKKLMIACKKTLKLGSCPPRVYEYNYFEGIDSEVQFLVNYYQSNRHK
eukprot:TRINITY_DN15661_c0_g1_i1.p1 TRINITY_DN15661_c0_g1~~TRINITY_DN15661_c0_g1_i1.p1  ORF type:complete len:309 (-),score=52.79 TRINITY_DN15661_c0_g1_i1:26-952(-)